MSCLSGFVIYLVCLTTKTAHYSLWPFKEKLHVCKIWIPVQTGLDKIDKAHFELWLNFTLLKYEAYTTHLFRAWAISVLFNLKTTRFSGCRIFLTNGSSTDSVTKNSAIENLCLIRNTRTFGFFPIPEETNKENTLIVELCHNISPKI